MGTKVHIPALGHPVGGRERDEMRSETEVVRRERLKERRARVIRSFSGRGDCVCEIMPIELRQISIEVP